MHGALGIERADEAEIVNALGDVWKQSRDIASALAILIEFPRTLQKRRIALGELADDGAVARGKKLAIVFVERGLGIESVEVAGRADHEQEDHRLGARLEVRRLGGESIHALRGACRGRQQRGQRDGAETVRGADEDIAARHRGTEVALRIISIRGHRRTHFG